MEVKMKIKLTAVAVTAALCAVLLGWLAVRAPSEAALEVQAYARSQGVSYHAYPGELVELLERNPETREFVLNYPFREEEAIDLSGYDLSQGVPLFLQWDTRWGYMKYGSGFVAETGCGPVCLAMAGYYVTGDAKFSPDKMVEFARDNGYYSPGNGSKWTLISEGGKTLGLAVKELPLVEKKIADYLRAGDPIIAAMGPGDFTSSGHYIVLTGYEDGLLSVNDPNSVERSEKRWSYETFTDQVRNLWVILPGTEQ